MCDRASRRLDKGTARSNSRRERASRSSAPQIAAEDIARTARASARVLARKAESIPREHFRLRREQTAQAVVDGAQESALQTPSCSHIRDGFRRCPVSVADAPTNARESA